MAIKDWTNRFMDMKSFLSSIGAVLVTLGAISTQIDTWVESVSKDIYRNVTAPSYIVIEYDLLKQLEKLSTSPEDVKDMDVQKFSTICDKDVYFTLEYIPNSKNSRGLRIACEKVLELNDQRYGL